MEELLSILKMSSSELKEKIYEYFLHQDLHPTNTDDFIYLEGNLPILLVAHIDTVCENNSKEILYDPITDSIFNFYGRLGGDDRCGIYAILKILKNYKPHILFTLGEEKGCLGAKKVIQILPKIPVKYIIELDRHGNNDCVFYDCGNQEFINYIKSFEFNPQKGTYTDISILGPTWDIASVNLSIGYYQEHTQSEYIIFNELQNNIERIKQMISSLDKVPYFNYQKKTSNDYSIFENDEDDEIDYLLKKSGRYKY